MKLVLKVGGHLLSREDGVLDLEYFKSLIKVLKELAERTDRLIVVVGGGRVAREYLNALRIFNDNNSILDMLGINVTRLNALLIAHALRGLALTEIPRSLEELSNVRVKSKVVVMGGLQPGYSTTAVAALAAENIDADLLLIATDVEGVYEEDPRVNPEARLLEEVSIEELLGLVGGRKALPGTYELVDLVTLKVLERSKIPAIIFKGKPPVNILKVLSGEGRGTKIVHT